MPKHQVHRQIYVFCFIFNSHQTLILIVDCSVRCLFIRIFFIAVIYIAGMCVYRSIQLLKVFQLFSTFDFQYTYVYLVNLLGRALFGILCDWVGICGSCSYTTIIIFIWRTLFDKLQNFFQKQFTTKQRVHNLCVTFVILKWFFTLYGSSTHDEHIYILYRVLKRVLKIVTLFNRIDMFKRINVNAEKKRKKESTQTLES